MSDNLLSIYMLYICKDFLLKLAAKNCISEEQRKVVLHNIEKELKKECEETCYPLF